MNVGVDMKILPHLHKEFDGNTSVQLYEMMTDTFSETILPLNKSY